jgi:hypothetical protein
MDITDWFLKVAEFDSPDNLLKDKNSRFYSLASEAGLITETVDQ